MSSRSEISILLPTRGRTSQLLRSIQSLIDHCDQPQTLEWLLAFDDDDSDNSVYFQANIAPEIDASGGSYTCFEFKRLGYQRLNEYLNALAPHAQAPWWVFWNDDAVMLDDHWDSVITAQGDRFCVQAFDTHLHHPYSIFPIVPKQWFEVLGYLSEHPLNDAYISQIAWMLDIMVRLPTRVEHDRYDLTGNNHDSTFRERDLQQLEGNPSSPGDFNFVTNRHKRFQAAKKLANYLTEQGYDMGFFKSVMQGRQNPWAKMISAENDPNQQVMMYR